jgi:predicted nucleic acid-binding Zn finger protein
MNLSLPHQARRVDPFAARDEQSEPFRRARDDEVDARPVDAVGRAKVKVGDGDTHKVVLVENDEGHVGYCDCDGFAFHDDLAGGCCTHLVALAMESVVNGGLIKTLDDVLEVDDVDQDGSAAEPEVVDESDDEIPDATSDALQEASADLTDRDDRADAPTPELDDPFAGALEDVDDQFVMTLGGDPYIRRAGFQRLARAEGYAVETEMRTWASDTDNELAEARARVLEDGEVVATGTGTAYLPEEDLSGAAGNLNELAETRALSRAMGWATGAGLSAVEVDAEAEYDREQEIATDGGR